MYSNFVTRKPVLNFRMTKKKKKKTIELISVCLYIKPSAQP